MLHNTALLSRVALHATDGDIGRVDDVYFSDESWTIRYLVVETGGWLSGRKVLVSPRAVRALDVGRSVLELELTREQVRESPSFDSDKPVSRQYETQHAQFYGYPFYWTGPYLWGTSEYPSVVGTPVATTMETTPALRARIARERAGADPHLRSAREVSGYVIEATDGAIGHVETLLFDDRSWSIGALVVDTRNWWPGRHVVIPPEWIADIDWAGSTLHVRVTRERIRTSAEYEPEHVQGRAEKAGRIVRTLLLE